MIFTVSKTLYFIAFILSVDARLAWADEKRAPYIAKPLTKEERSPHIKEADIKAQCPYPVEFVKVYWLKNGHYLAALPDVGMYGPPQEKDDHAEWWLAPFNSKWEPAPPVVATCFSNDVPKILEISIPPEVVFCYLEKGDPKRPQADIRRFWCR